MGTSAAATGQVADASGGATERLHLTYRGKGGGIYDIALFDRKAGKERSSARTPPGSWTGGTERRERFRINKLYYGIDRDPPMACLLWFIVFLLLLGTELAMSGRWTFVCPALGALAAAAAALLGAGPVLAPAVFFGVALLAVPLVPVVRRLRSGPPREPVALDASPGQRARVTEPLDPGWGRGRVRLATGVVAPAVSDHPIPVDAWVEVVSVEGGQLRVRPLIPPMR